MLNKEQKEGRLKMWCLIIGPIVTQCELKMICLLLVSCCWTDLTLRSNLVRQRLLADHTNSSFALQWDLLPHCSSCFYEKSSPCFLLPPERAFVKRRNPKACLAHSPKQTVSRVLSCFCALPEFFENPENDPISCFLSLFCEAKWLTAADHFLVVTACSRVS